MAADPTMLTLTGDPVIEEARKRFNQVSEWESYFRRMFLQDWKFANGDSYNGYQWPESIRRTRDVADRPCLTMNITRQHNLKIANEGRQNKSSVRLIGTGNGATQESANIFKNIIRYIERRSNAQTAYTLARGFQVDAGYAAWRLVTEYESNETFDQEIRILPILDPLSVCVDPDCQQPDKSDMNWGFVFDFLPNDVFEENYPDHAPGGRLAVGQTPLGIGTGESFWIEKEHTMICEYFRKVKRPDVLVSFWDEQSQRRWNIRKSRMPGDLFEQIVDDKLTRTRDIYDTDVEWYLIAGEQIIDHTLWLGSYIPLIIIVGQEKITEGILDRKGHTRAMIDAQRMYNYNAAIDVSTPVPTPIGWLTMGELEVGDIVFGPDGNAAVIKEALPVKYDEECYKITFTNGHSIITDAGHIWRVEERGKRKAATFDWIDTTVCTAELVPNKHFIVLTKPLNLLNVDNLPIDPYVLGVWLGDGHSSSAAVSSNFDDVAEQRCLIEKCGYSTGDVRAEVGRGCVFNIEELRIKLRHAGLKDNKHVPTEYLRASFQQRLSLLQGLMDTDGHFASAVNQCVFVSGSKKIARAALEICVSLGINATVNIQPERMHENEKYISKKTYRVQFTADPDLPVFRLSRKLYQQTAARKVHWRRTKRVGIRSIVAVESVPVRCIMLDSPDHMYLVGHGMVPTHNSSQVEFVALQGKSPWVAPAKAIEEYENYWNTANTENHSVLPYNDVDEDNPDRQIQMPQRTDPPNFSPAYEKGMETAFNQLMMTSGQWQNEMGMVGNERTGRAIERRQEQSATSVFHFQDEYAAGLRNTYVQIIELIPLIYDTRRVRFIEADDGEEFEVEIDPRAQQAYQVYMDRQGRAIARIFNPNIGKYAVDPQVGPDSGTRRQEAVDAFTMILTEAPGLTGLIGDLMLRNLPFEDAQEAALRLKRMVPPQALGQGPTQNEQQQQQMIQQLQAALAKVMERQGKDQLKLAGKDQMRDIDAYEAETKRMQALATMLPTDAQGLQQIIHQLVGDSLQTHLLPILRANMAGTIAEGGGNGNSGSVGTNGSGGNGISTGGLQAGGKARGGANVEPRFPGARQAPDGEWYILDPTRRGKYLRVGPLAQERALPKP